MKGAPGQLVATAAEFCHGIYAGLLEQLKKTLGK
jgi:hypothetical protein